MKRTFTKAVSVLLVLMLCLSIGAVGVMADSLSTATANSVDNGGTFTMDQAIVATGTDAPKEAFAYTVELQSVTGSSKYDGTNTKPANDPTIAEAKTGATSGATASESKTSTTTATVTLPTYDSVGVYTYKVSEAATPSAGVTTQELYMQVTVVNSDAEGTYKCYVNLYSADPTDSNSGAVKVTGFVNGSDATNDPKLAATFEGGTLAVTKTVSGDLGDKQAYFKITVTLTGAASSTYASSYAVTGTTSYTGTPSNPTTVEVKAGEETTVDFYLKNGETVTITGLPKDVTYGVSEDAYDGYTTTYKSNSGTESDEDISSQTVGTTANTAEVINTKGSTSNTGVLLDSLPYILIGAVVVVGLGAVVIAKKRKHNEE